MCSGRRSRSAPARRPADRLGEALSARRRHPGTAARTRRLPVLGLRQRDADPGCRQGGTAERGQLVEPGPDDGAAGHVGQELDEVAAPGEAAIDRQRARPGPPARRWRPRPRPCAARCLRAAPGTDRPGSCPPTCRSTRRRRCGPSAGRQGPTAPARRRARARSPAAPSKASSSPRSANSPSARRPLDRRPGIVDPAVDGIDGLAADATRPRSAAARARAPARSPHRSPPARRRRCRR